MSHEVAVGWDIGGAHLKAACLDAAGKLQWVRQGPCPLWRGLQQLGQALEPMLAHLPADARVRHGITMTGELVDLFPNRREGVVQIVRAVTSGLNDLNARFFAGADGLVSADVAVRFSERVASANWLASAGWAADRLAGGLMVDIGSTTTDIVPFGPGGVRARGAEDFGRLQSEELLYTGVVRTPVCTLADRVPFEGHWVTLAAEHFSTVADVYRLMDALPADADQYPTPDRASHSRTDSARRLARMIGRDLDSAQMEQWHALAEFIAEEQVGRILRSCRRVLSRGVVPRGAPVVGAGVGRFIARDVARRLQRPYLDFGDLCVSENPRIARYAADCAPAVALAHLARLCGQEESYECADGNAALS